VLVPFEPHPRHGRRCAGRRRHDGRVILREGCIGLVIIIGFSW
jgi:hypothetical protein